jgi:hypothetical protein
MVGYERLIFIYNSENRIVSIFIHSVSKSFKYDLMFLSNYSVDRTYIIKTQERLICSILICPQKLTVLVKRFTV